jgi:hypothetical protein
MSFIFMAYGLRIILVINRRFAQNELLSHHHYIKNDVSLHINLY